MVEYIEMDRGETGNNSVDAPVYYNPLGNGRGVKYFNGDGIDIGNGWKTKNVSTLAVQTKESIILMDNGSGNTSQVNIIWKIPNIEKLAGKTICISVEARVHRLTEEGYGGVLAFINASNYNAGKFYQKIEFVNHRWERLQLAVRLTDAVARNGGVICLRAINKKRAAVVEFRNLLINEGERSNLTECLQDDGRADSWDFIRNLVLAPDGRNLFMQRYQQVVRGYYVANKIISEDLSKHYFIMQKHIGDVMRMMKSMIIYRQFYSSDFLAGDEVYATYFANNILPEKMIVVTSRLNAGVCALYNSVDDVIVLEKSELEELAYYAKSDICVQENLHSDELGLFGDRVGEQEIATMYGMGSYNWVLNFPTAFPGKNDKMLSSMKIKEESIEHAKDILKENNTDAMHAIILCPSARSSSGIDERYWIHSVKYFKHHGYTVFTNVGRNEAEMEGTVRLYVPVDVYAAFGYLGATIIGVQSGIVDVVRWLLFDIPVIDIHALYKPIDYKYAKNRNVKFPLDIKNNVTHMAVEPEEMDGFSKRLIGVFEYNRKGHIQKEKFLKNEIAQKLKIARDINEYMHRIMELSHCIVFMCVYDSANKYWSKVDTSILKLQSDIGRSWRRSFVAVIDLDSGFHYELMKENCAFAVYQDSFEDMDSEERDRELPSDNHFYVCSHAMGARHYTKSAVVINGQNYSLNGRGLNIVIYDKEVQSVIDSVYVDLWADEKLSVRRKDFEINGRF